MSPLSQNEPELARYVREADLAYFVHDRLSPVVTKMTRPSGQPAMLLNYFRAELLEAFAWLHAGVKIEYFPEVLSRRVFYEYSHLFLAAYEAILEAKLIDTWFPSPIRNIWESEFSGRQQIFSSGQKWMEVAGPEKFASPFQTLSLLANGFAQDPEARFLVQAMTLCSETDWIRLIENNIPPPIADLPEPTDGSEVSHRTSMGFFAVLEYMQAIRRVVADVQDSLSLRDRSGVSLYIELLKQAQQWRLNLGYTEPRLRFLQVARRVASECVVQIDHDQTEASGLVERFVKELEPLMRDWGAPQAAVAG